MKEDEKMSETVIEKARRIVDGHAADRDSGKESGKERSMKLIVDVFNTLTGNTLTEHDGDVFMICLKLVRMQRSKSNDDNYIDAIGYLQMASEVKD